ncbi:hypothetical protein [Devosia sp. SL43]|uniref:hypothetical protein n=1 Tax=Devosia sp. SL43 TaxID=2806348 RepID=UPI001F2ED104|nr:hypothetical protein [Devosia sp. SL43]UJW86894.1 hypothetical protein IM737_06515 [Devosia sp. SL43]
MTAHAAANPHNKTPRYFAVSAFAIPVLILTGFAMVSTLPVVLLVVGVLRDTRVRPLRWWVALTSGLFAIALINWALKGDFGISLTSTLHPILAGAIVLSALVIVAKLIWKWRN